MLSSSRTAQAILQSHLPASPAQTFTTLTASATPHAKGAYTTLLTTTYDVYGFWVGILASGAAATRTDMMLDVAIGANQENIILPEWLCGWRGNADNSPQFNYFPIFVPRNVLISARIQALISNDFCNAVLFVNGGSSGHPVELFRGCDAIGTDPALSIGTSHTCGDTGVESTAANIGSVTAKHYGAVSLNVQGTMSQTAMAAMSYHWELVIGAETRCEWYFRTSTNEQVGGPWPPAAYFLSVPSGTQLQVRGECSGTAQALDVALYGYY